MKEKLKSRKFWTMILSSIVSITVVFSDVGGLAGTIFGIIGILASTISYIIVEGKIDEVKVHELYSEFSKLKTNESEENK